MSRTYVIYKIKSLDPTVDYCYVGSTQNFTKRKCQHKSRCNVINKNSDSKLYNTMRENGGWINFEMTPIEEYKCDTPQQAHIREQYWIENIEEQKLNSIAAFIGLEPKEYKKEYKALNKYKIAEQNKEYRAVNKDKIAEYRAVNKDKIAQQRKEYRAVNKEKFADYQKEYRAVNKEKIAQQKKEYRLKMKMLKKENSLNVL